MGADVEVFLQNAKTYEYISAEGIIKGSKHDPHFFVEGNPYYATSLDNVMAEFCIPPAINANDFHYYIQSAICFVEDQLPDNVIIKAEPSVIFNSHHLRSENANVFGCDPDYDAWKGGVINDKPDTSALPNLRSCGGHIHIGYENPNQGFNMDIIRAMDIFVGLPSILQEPDNKRKQLYGKAGAFRHKKYGVEYRTISNYYINSEVLTKWVFNSTHQAIDFVNKEIEISKEEGDAVIIAINKNDKSLAKTMCNYFGVKFAA